MNMKRVSLGGLVLTLLCLGVVRGEGMSAPNGGMGGPLFPNPAADPARTVPGGSAADQQAPGGTTVTAPATPSSYMDYPRCLGCCGPVGGDGPLGYEIYARNGMNFTIGNNPFGSRMATGWDITVGARTLFFNPERDAAWTADLSITNIYNSSNDRHTTYGLFNVFEQAAGANIPQVSVAIRDLNRTYANVAGGREWYLMGCADSAKPDTNWRVGFDVGGRYGTEKLEVSTIRHRTDTMAGLFLSVHSDIEVPVGCSIFQAGLRAEYGYTWSDILQRQNDGDVQDINLMATVGVRF